MLGPSLRSSLSSADLCMAAGVCLMWECFCPVSLGGGGIGVHTEDCGVVRVDEHSIGFARYIDCSCTCESNAARS